MKAFEKWWMSLRFPVYGNFIDADSRYDHKAPSDVAKDVWRAALEHILRMKISSAHCKTELDVLRDWIKRELEEE